MAFFKCCELDAAYFLLYDIEKDDTAYIMNSFPIVKGNDEKTYGTYRTKKKIIVIYEDMSRAIALEKPDKTQLIPGPANQNISHK